VLRTDVATLIGSQAFIESNFTGADKGYVVCGIGCDPLVDKKVAVFTGGGWSSGASRQINVFSGLSGTLARTLRLYYWVGTNPFYPPAYAIGRMTYYNNHWYSTADGYAATIQNVYLSRLTANLTARDGDSIELSARPSTVSLYHVGAENADYIYYSINGAMTKITNEGATHTALSVHSRCEPHCNSRKINGLWCYLGYISVFSRNAVSGHQ
jgi:hypothetical protein